MEPSPEITGPDAERVLLCQKQLDLTPGRETFASALGEDCIKGDREGDGEWRVTVPAGKKAGLLREMMQDAAHVATKLGEMSRPAPPPAPEAPSASVGYSRRFSNADYWRGRE